MKTSIIVFLVSMVILGIYSCHCSEHCDNIAYQFTVAIEEYSDSDVTPVVLKSYAKGSNFTVFRDSVVYTNLANGNMLVSDTIEHTIAFIKGNDSTDYKLILPKIGVSYFITGMNFPLGDCKACGKNMAEPILTNYILNGISVNNLAVLIYK